MDLTSFPTPAQPLGEVPPRVPLSCPPRLSLRLRPASIVEGAGAERGNELQLGRKPMCPAPPCCCARCSSPLLSQTPPRLLRVPVALLPLPSSTTGVLPSATPEPPPVATPVVTGVPAAAAADTADDAEGCPGSCRGLQLLGDAAPGVGAEGRKCWDTRACTLKRTVLARGMGAANLFLQAKQLFSKFSSGVQAMIGINMKFRFVGVHPVLSARWSQQGRACAHLAKTRDISIVSTRAATYSASRGQGSL
eukprot:scaffold34311_cov19-Tisochrysis_lutea.AAC.1